MGVLGWIAAALVVFVLMPLIVSQLANVRSQFGVRAKYISVVRDFAIAFYVYSLPRFQLWISVSG